MYIEEERRCSGPALTHRRYGRLTATLAQASRELVNAVHGRRPARSSGSRSGCSGKMGERREEDGDWDAVMPDREGSATL